MKLYTSMWAESPGPDIYDLDGADAVLVFPAVLLLLTVIVVGFVMALDRPPIRP
jgi:hypothetical protein